MEPLNTPSPITDIGEGRPLCAAHMPDDNYNPFEE